MEDSQEIKEKLNEICTKIENALIIEQQEKILDKKADNSKHQYENMDDEVEMNNNQLKKNEDVSFESSNQKISIEDNDKEQSENKEDRKDPAYIPRKGYFYEHDDRYGDDEEMEKARRQNRQNKLSKKKIDGKWTHDLFEKNFNYNENRVREQPKRLENAKGEDNLNENKTINREPKDTNKNNNIRNKNTKNNDNNQQNNQQKLKISDYVSKQNKDESINQRTKSSTIESNTRQYSNRVSATRSTEENYYFDVNSRSNQKFSKNKNFTQINNQEKNYWQNHKQSNNHKSIDNFKSYQHQSTSSFNEGIKKSTSFTAQPQHSNNFHSEQNYHQHDNNDDKPKRYSSMRNQSRPNQQQQHQQSWKPNHSIVLPTHGRPIIGAQLNTSAATFTPTSTVQFTQAHTLPTHLLIAPPPGLALPQLQATQQATPAAYFNFMPTNQFHHHQAQNQIYFNSGKN